MGLWSSIKKAFTTKVDVKKYTKKKKTTGEHYSRKGKTATKKSGGSKSSASSETSSGTANISRKGKSTTTPVRQTVAKAQKTGQRKATEEKQYLEWKKVQPAQKAEAAKANPISVKRNRSELKNAGVPHTTAVGDSGKRESYKSTKDFYKKNPEAQKKASTVVKDEYKYGNRAYRGAADRILENLGMESKSKQADRRLGTKINESKEVKKAKASKEYEAGQFIGDAVAFAVPGAAEETVARGLLKGGAKVAKVAVKAGSRGGKISAKALEKSVVKGAEKAVKSKATSSAEKSAAKALLKSDKTKKFAAERAADTLVSSPMNLAAASADSEDGKGTLKNFAANVAGDIAMGSAVSAIKAGKSKVSGSKANTVKNAEKAVKTADANVKQRKLKTKEPVETVKTEKTGSKTEKTGSPENNVTSRKLKQPVKSQQIDPDNALFDRNNLVARAAIKEAKQSDGNIKTALKGIASEVGQKTEKTVKNASSEDVRSIPDSQLDEYVKSHGVSDVESAAHEGKTDPHAEEFTNKPNTLYKKGEKYTDYFAEKEDTPEAYYDYKPAEKSIKDDGRKASMFIREKFFDDRAALGDMAKESGNEAATHAINATRTTDSKVNYNVNEKQTNFAGNKEIGPSVRDVMTVVRKFAREKFEDWTDYLNHANNIARANAGHPMFGKHSASDSIAKVAELESKYKGDADFLDTAKQAQTISRNLLDWYADSGMLSKADAKHYADKNPYHLMAVRDLDFKGGSSKAGREAEVRGLEKAYGSEKPLLSIEQQLTKEIEKVAKKTQINKMLNELSEGQKVYFEKDGEIADIRTGEIEDVFSVKNAGEDGFKVSFFKDGKRCFMYVNENAGKEIQKLLDAGNKDLDAFNRILDATTGRAAKLIKTLSTTLSPAFMIKNPLRDIQSGFINSVDFKRFTANIPKAYKSIAKKDDWWKMYSASGAKMSSFTYKDKGVAADINLAFKDIIEKSQNGENISGEVWKNLKSKFKKPLDAVEAFNAYLENATRLAEFRTVGERIMKEKGYESFDEFTANDINKMAHAAAEVSVNFARGGTWSKWINSKLVPFFNAGIQGTSREYRLMRDAVKSKDAKKCLDLAFRFAAFGIAPAVINEMCVKLADKDTQEEYNQINEFKRYQNYYFKIGGVWVQIPAGRINSISAMASRLMLNSKNYTADQALHTALELASPGNVLTDNVFMPFVNSMIRNKTWYGADIVSKFDKEKIADGKKKASDVYDETTSAYAEFFGKSYVAEHFDISPKQIDAMLDQYGGSWAKMLHTATQKKSELHNPVLMQILDAFTTDPIAKNSLQSKLYDKMSKVAKSKSSDSEEYKKLQKYSYRLNNINDAIAQIQSSDGYNKDDALKVRELYKYRNQICRDAINGKRLKTDYEAADIQMIREKVGNDKIVATEILFKDFKKKSDDELIKPAKILKGGYKNYTKLLDVYEDSCSYPDSNKTYALALAKNNADRKLVYAYGVSQDEIKEAKDAIKTGVSYSGLADYYSELEKTKKRMGITGSYTPTMVKYIALKNADSEQALTSYMSAGTVNSRSYHQRKLNAAFAAKELGLTDKELSKARTASNTGRKSNPKDYLTSAKEATAYVEKHYKHKSAKFKAAVWESICNAYFDNGKNPYGEVKKADVRKAKTKFNSKKVKEISSDMPTTFGNGQYTKKQRNTLANKAFLRDKLAVVNKAKAVANGKADLKVLTDELDKQSGNNGVTRQTRSYFEEKKTTAVSPKASSSGSSSGSYKKYGKSYRKGSSGGSSGSSSSKQSSSKALDYDVITSNRKTKSYGMTDSEIKSLHKKLLKVYGEKTANAYITRLSTQIK